MNKQKDIKMSNEFMQVMAGKLKVDECKHLGKKKKPKAVSKNRTEGQEQAAIFTWANQSLGKYPELKLLFAIPNGGSRHMIEAVNLKRQGVKSGLPDMFLPVPKGSFYGLWIELKVGKNKTSENQDKWLYELCSQGYRCEVCYGFDEAVSVLKDYLGEVANG